MRKARTVVVGMLITSVAALLGAGAAHATIKPGCPGAKALVVDATMSVENVDDVATDGHVWALDDYTSRVRLWRVGTDAYCARLDDIGTFTTFAGVSPAGTGTVTGGLTGSFAGTQYINVTGEFAPKVATTGYIGNFDVGCNQQGVCANHDNRFTVHYFERIRAVRFGWFSVSYVGSNGEFTQSTNGDSGDITG